MGVKELLSQMFSMALYGTVITTFTLILCAEIQGKKKPGL